AEEQPPVTQLGLGVPADTDHGVRAVGQVQPGRVRLAVLVDRARDEVVRVYVAQIVATGQGGHGQPDVHGLALARPERAVVTGQLGGTSCLHGRGEPRVPLMHRDRGAFGQLAELLYGLYLDLVAVHRLPSTVRDQDDQAPVRDAREHPLDHLAGLVHARDHHDHVLLDLADSGRRHPQAGARAIDGLVAVPAVEFDHPLQLMDPDGAETLRAVRTLQTHAATLPPPEGICTPPIGGFLGEYNGNVGIIYSAVSVMGWFTQLISPRSRCPTSSIGCAACCSRSFWKVGRPASSSAIHSRANSPDWTSLRILRICSFTRSSITRGPRVRSPYSAVSETL